MNDIASATVGYMTPEREMLRQIAREFTDKEVLPAANELDPKKGTIPQSLIDQMVRELGFFGIVIPEEYGGAGLGAFEYCLVAEELARGWMSVASIIARGNGFYRSIPFDEERRKRIELMATGQVPRCARHVGAGGWVGHLVDHLPGADRGRPLGDHRQQVLVHLRRRRELHPGHRADGAAIRRSATRA